MTDLNKIAIVLEQINSVRRAVEPFEADLRRRNFPIAADRLRAVFDQAVLEQIYSLS